MRLLRLVNSFDQGAVDPGAFRFVTLTYPREFPAARATKVHLDTILKRFEREWGRRGMIWKLEAQKRGAPHYHLLILMGSQHTLGNELTWWVENWCEVIGEDRLSDCWKVHMGNVRDGRQCVEVVKDWGGVAAYCGKYLAKPCGNSDEWQSPGRWWGVRRRELLPVQVEKCEAAPEAAKLIRRTLVRWIKHQPTGFVLAVKRRASGSIVRKVITAKEARTNAHLYADCDYLLRPILRRWRRSQGGCNVFLAERVFWRVVEWAYKMVGIDRCAIDVGKMDPAPF